MNLIELEDIFMKQLTESRSEKTAVKYKERLTYFRKYCQDKGLIEPGELSMQEIRQFACHMGRQELSTNSKYVYMDATKRFLAFLEAESYLFLPLSECIRLPKWERKKKQVYSAKQIESMLNKLEEPGVIHARNKVIVALALAEELRTGDIYNLSVIDVDLDAEELRITRQKRFQKMKTTTVKLLKEYLRSRQCLRPKVDWLLINKYGERLRGQDIGKAVKRVLQK